MSQGMLCALWNIRNIKGYVCKMCLGITHDMRLRTDRGEKISSHTFVLTAFNFFGQFNILPIIPFKAN
jgi:hypothetical protein